MKIAIADNTSQKFSRDIIEHWSKKHELKYQAGASAELAQWADLYYIDWADNNLAYLYKLYTTDVDNQRPPDWDNKKKPTIVVRAFDWEIWTLAMHRTQEVVDWVDKWIVIAPHIEKKLRAEANFKELKLIRPGVNLDRFPLKSTTTDGKQIGMVLGDMWWPKNHMGGLEIFNMLGDGWHLHIRGQHEGGEYWPLMYEHYLDSRGIRDSVTLYPHMDDMNEFYEKIDILLHPGMKETFSYAVGEAMTKGIRPVIYNFLGAKDIWPKKYLFNDYNQAVHMLQDPNPYDPMEFRNYIEKNYSIDRMLKEYDEYLGC